MRKTKTNVDDKDIRNEVEEERQKLLKVFEKLNPSQLSINLELINNVAFLGVQLKHLANDIAINGVKEEYKNGENQFGYKERTEAKVYNNMIKNYQSCMKQLNDLLGDEELLSIEDEDPFK